MTTERRKGGRIAGLVLHGLIGGIMVLSGGAKVLGLMPPDELAKHGLGGQIALIGAGEVLAAALLLVPRTTSLGTLLVSAFWGGAICLHMSHGEPYVLQSALLVLTWVGAFLRDPATLNSFTAAPEAAKAPGASRPVLV